MYKMVHICVCVTSKSREHHSSANSTCRVGSLRLASLTSPELFNLKLRPKTRRFRRAQPRLVGDKRQG